MQVPALPRIGLRAVNDRKYSSRSWRRITSSTRFNDDYGDCYHRHESHGAGYAGWTRWTESWLPKSAIATSCGFCPVEKPQPGTTHWMSMVAMLGSMDDAGCCNVAW